MMDDTPSGELASKTFEKHFNKTQGMILLGLMFTAEQRISSACDEDFDDDFHLPSVSLLEYMEKHKYLRRIEAVRDGEARTYWTLSSKGWACFSKKEVAAQLRKMDIDLNSIGTDSAVNWTKLVTARYIELFDYMLALKEHYWARRWDEIVYGAVIDDEAIY